MSQPELSTSSRLLSLVGIIGAILAFGAILFVAYLPSRPDPIDQAVNEERQAKADEARAAGVAKLARFRSHRRRSRHRSYPNCGCDGFDRRGLPSREVITRSIHS